MASTSDSLTRLLMHHEGLRLKPYIDTTGHLSIGYGRNLKSVGISEAEAQILLSHDIDTALHALCGACPWVEHLSPVRQAVLVDMAFNLGIRGLLTFTRTLRLIEAGDYEAAAVTMLQSKWSRQVKGRARRLAEMMRADAWPDIIAPREDPWNV